MSLFGAQSIFAAAASTEEAEALERAKELNRERLPVSGDTKTTAGAESGPESPVGGDQQASSADVPGSPAWLQRLRGQTIVFDEEASPSSDPAAPTSASSEFQLAQGQTIGVDDATSLSTAAPLAESVPMTFETWKGLFLQHVQEGAAHPFPQHAEDGSKCVNLHTVEAAYLAKVEEHFAHPANKNFCENWAAVKFPDAGQISDGERPGGCWEKSEAWRAAKRFQAAALLKNDELTGIFENIRSCAPAYVERLSTISEPLFSDEAEVMVADTKAVRSLCKSARDLLVGIVCDLRKFHQANLRKIHGNKYQCSDPDALARQWGDALARPGFVDVCESRSELSTCAKELSYHIESVLSSVLHKTCLVWNFCAEDMENIHLLNMWCK